MKIQIKGVKVCLRHKGKTLLGIIIKLFVFKSLSTTPSNVLPLQKAAAIQMLTTQWRVIRSNLLSLLKFSKLLLCFYFIFRLKYVATLLPIRTVGVQGDARSYSYAVAISCSKEQLGTQEWTDMLYFAKLIPRVCHNINRVTYVFGKIFDHNSTRSYS